MFFFMQWFLRFGDDSLLLQPVKVDIFHQLNEQGKRYAYKYRLAAPQCMQEMQSLGRALCDTYLESLKVNSKSCKQSLTNKEIDEGGIILSIFEASHISVWESDICLAIFYAAGDVFIREIIKNRSALNRFFDLFSSSQNADFRLLNVSRSLSDSQAHNLCVQLALPPSDAGELEDVFYTFKWRNDAGTNLNHNPAVKASTLMELDAIFSPQRGC